MAERIFEDDKLTQAVSIISSIVGSLVTIAASWNSIRSASTDELTDKLAAVDAMLRDEVQAMQKSFASTDAETDAALTELRKEK